MYTLTVKSYRHASLLCFVITGVSPLVGKSTFTVSDTGRERGRHRWIDNYRHHSTKAFSCAGSQTQTRVLHTVHYVGELFWQTYASYFMLLPIWELGLEAQSGAWNSAACSLNWWTETSVLDSIPSIPSVGSPKILKAVKGAHIITPMLFYCPRYSIFLTDPHYWSHYFRNQVKMGITSWLICDDGACSILKVLPKA